MAILKKGQLFFVYKNQFETFLETYTPEVSRPLLRKIAEACFDHHAPAVALFLNNKGGTSSCVCYMPIYNSINTFEQCGYEFADIDACIFLDVLIIEDILWELPRGKIFTIKEIAAREGYWQQEYAILVFGQNGDKGTMKSMDMTPFSNMKIEKESIDFERQQLGVYTDLVNRHPSNKLYKRTQLRLVRLIEDHEKLLNVETGFAKLQYEAHFLAFRLKEFALGKFDALVFEPVVEMIDGFIKNIHKSMMHSYLLQVSALASTSAVLFVDMVPKDVNPELMKGWEAGREHLRKTIAATSVLTKKGDPGSRVNAFCKKAKLDPEQAKNVLGSVQKIFPKSAEGHGTLEIYSRDSEKPLVTFSHEGLDFFTKAKKDLEDSLKPVEETTVSGFLGQIYGWEGEAPRFVIETEEKRRLTIRYTSEQTSEVTARFKRKVTLERIKEGRGWNLLSWK